MLTIVPISNSALCFVSVRSPSVSFNSRLLLLQISVNCSYCSVIPTLDTIRIRFKMSQSLTAFSFFHLFVFIYFLLFGTHNRHYSSTITLFLHHLRVVFFCQLISELNFHFQAIHPTNCALDRRVLVLLFTKMLIDSSFSLGYNVVRASRLMAFHPLSPAMPTNSR